MNYAGACRDFKQGRYCLKWKYDEISTAIDSATTNKPTTKRTSYASRQKQEKETVQHSKCTNVPTNPHQTTDPSQVRLPARMTLLQLSLALSLVPLARLGTVHRCERGMQQATPAPHRIPPILLDYILHY